MHIARIFDEVAQQMRANLERASKAVQHPGLKGTAFEEVFRAFLRAYLPQALDISTGVLVDANGGHSRQLDVIISDADKTPIFYRSGDTRVTPVEARVLPLKSRPTRTAASMRCRNRTRGCLFAGPTGRSCCSTR